MTSKLAYFPFPAIVAAFCGLLLAASLPLSGQSPEDGAQRLLDASGGRAIIHTDPKTGLARRVQLPVSAAKPAYGASVEARSAELFARHGGLFGIRDVGSELILLDVVSNPIWTQLTYHQLYKGLPVVDGILTVTFDSDDRLIEVHGSFVPGLTLSTRPTWTAAEAAAITAEGFFETDPGAFVTSTASELVIYRVPANDGEVDDDHLAWQVEVTDLAGVVRQRVFVDAHDGEVLAKMAGTNSFHCNNDGLFVHGTDAQLGLVDRSTNPASFPGIGIPAGIEINSIGFRKNDGLLWGLELTETGTSGVVTLDNSGTVTSVGAPPGLPDDLRFDAGDVSHDGTLLMVSVGGISSGGSLYRIPLPALAPVTSVEITGGTGKVNDWATHPSDGLLYGGDQTHGQVATLNPLNGERVDLDVPGLPTGVSYGAAWFDADGRLVLYRNNGEIYEIDLTVPAVTGPFHPGPETSHNDGAACAQNLLGTALQMTASGGELPQTVTIEVAFDNLGGGGDLFNLSATSNLAGVFGSFDDDWRFRSIVSDPASFANPGFDGANNTELVATGQGLEMGARATVTVEIDVLDLSNLDPVGNRFCHQILARGQNASGVVFEDVSTEGPFADLDGDGLAGEQMPSCVTMGQVILAPNPSGDAYSLRDGHLYHVDPSTSPPTLTLRGSVEIDGQPIEVNAMGFRRSDRLFYGVQLTADGNEQLVQIDGDSNVFSLGRPLGLPADLRFDGGDVSTDSGTMFLSEGGRGHLYRVDLSSRPMATTAVEISGAVGAVNDWAVHPKDGMLYGGDQTHGQVARLDPVTGVRTDTPVTGLPSGVPFGGAWFDNEGHLLLERNTGDIFEIDLASSTVTALVTGDPTKGALGSLDALTLAGFDLDRLTLDEEDDTSDWADSLVDEYTNLEFVPVRSLPLSRQAEKLDESDRQTYGLNADDERAFMWDSGDNSNAANRWLAQGIAGIRLEDPQLNMMLVSWHYKEKRDDPCFDEIGLDKGVRVSFVNVTPGEPFTYRHVLLVEPVRGEEEPHELVDPPNFQQIKFHAGGMGYSGGILYVADTRHGLRLFDLDKIIGGLEEDLPDKDRIGMIGGKAYAFDYRYILPQVAHYDKLWQGLIDVGFGKKPEGDYKPDTPNFSFVSMDWTEDPPSLLTGSYITGSKWDDGERPKLFLWKLSADRRSLAPEVPRQILLPPDSKEHFTLIQGAARRGDELFLSRSGKKGVFHHTLDDDLRVPQPTQELSPHLPFEYEPVECDPNSDEDITLAFEDLHISKSSNNLWGLSEGNKCDCLRGHRIVFWKQGGAQP